MANNRVIKLRRARPTAEQKADLASRIHNYRVDILDTTQTELSMTYGCPAAGSTISVIETQGDYSLDTFKGVDEWLRNQEAKYEEGKKQADKQAEQKKLTVEARLTGKLGNENISIPTIYRGHRWTDEEFRELCKGKSIVITVCAYDKDTGAYKTNQTKMVEVRLEKKKENGYTRFAPAVVNYIAPETQARETQDTTFLNFLKELRELIDKYVEVK